MSNPVTITAPEGLPFVDIVREFDHPVEKVFRAHKDPAIISRWLGPRGYEMEVQEYDYTTGGGYRYVHKDGQGGEYRFRGVFHVVRENEFAVQTFEFEGVPDQVSIESIRFEPLEGGRTRISAHAVYPTLEARDGMVASGQERGVTQGYEQLDEVLAEQ